MQPIATLTMNPALDISTSVDIVVPEHKLRCKAPLYEPGGGGLNVARAISKLGGHAVACYLAGGHTGTLLQELLAQEGIDSRPIPVAERTRESFSVFEEASTQQYRFNMPGPTVTPEECIQMVEILASLTPRPAYLVVSGSHPPGISASIYKEFATLADDTETRLIVDTSGPALQGSLEAGVYLTKPNIRELGTMVGQQIENDEHLLAVCTEIVKKGQAHAVVVSLGAGGAILVMPDGWTRYRAPTVPIASKVGAGDSMVGGIVLALARGESLVEAVRYGVAAGASAVMTPGSMLCQRDDTERLYGQMVKEAQ